MRTARLEAFSDGVIAIIITIMVLELKTPHRRELSALAPIWPVMLSYLISFLYVGIYWNNHHHLLHAAERVDGRVLWANLHLLFWLSLLPFVTSWLGETHFAPWPAVAYGIVLTMCALSWMLLSLSLRRLHPVDSPLNRALRRGGKEQLSLVAYLGGVLCAFRWPELACIVYVLVGLLWFIPDSRLEHADD